MIDDKIEQYIENHTSPEDVVLHELRRKTHLKVIYPRMISGHVQGKFLEMISFMIRPESILEVGTFTGYSAICMAKGLSDSGVLHTIDNNPELTKLSSGYIEKSGLSDKIIQHEGDAFKIIPGINESFDLVFLDAAKEIYLDLYHLIFQKVKPGGFILADNTLWGGTVLKAGTRNDKEAKGIASFNDFVQNDERVENVLVSIRDGVMIIRKK